MQLIQQIDATRACPQARNLIDAALGVQPAPARGRGGHPAVGAADDRPSRLR